MTQNSTNTGYEARKAEVIKSSKDPARTEKMINKLDGMIAKAKAAGSSTK